MKKYLLNSVGLFTAISLQGCMASQTPDYLPALLVQPNANTRIILETAIGQLLNSQPIKLANSVFTKQHTIMIERQQTINGDISMGRGVDFADSVSLLTKSGKCYLQHVQSKRIEQVKGIGCQALHD
ncbi:hypothetical protein [uncultured Paraglaciecola sp.]|uniref:hypothetical protein n=1 Tax=uncultured Paraglaciecola sp. TaxID=1765024 RepID=UPI0026038440|nr:hypothetical protein [uncultured Paraglaciecola sp.]